MEFLPQKKGKQWFKAYLQNQTEVDCQALCVDESATRAECQS